MPLPPDQQKQLNEQKKQCIFCKLISGEMQAKKVFENEKVIAMLDIYPAVKGHTLFLPKEHYPLMLYLDPEEFNSFFGLIPALAKALKDSLVKTGINIFIASGGAAGQQSYHFLVHLLPREQGDGFFNFYWGGKAKLAEDKVLLLTKAFQEKMNKRKGPSFPSVEKALEERPTYLKEIYENSSILFEDETVLVILAKKGLVPGHIEIYSKEEEKFIEKLSEESSTHLFSIASLASGIIFDQLKAQGTNIILKSGSADDNPQGRLSLHILPRTNEDDLNKTLLWAPKQSDYDLDSLVGKIKEKTWKIGYKEKKEIKERVVLPSKTVLGGEEKKKISEKPAFGEIEREIKEAIERIKRDFNY